ncbi:MAG TPA: D-isomer specific 2-hydroxyacid dehydrogenase family protein [Trebonia sp.]|nr:D-isomer specific 2-hydroxyacid dehydrogenase family protein [Trebonia sp.]
MVAAPRIAVGPGPDPLARDAIQRGGGLPVAAGEPASGLVWLDGRDAAGLRSVLEAVPAIRWVQLPFAGVESFTGRDLLADGRLWTCAKGAYGEAVAEHALTLALAGLRQIPARARAGGWGPQGGASLYGQPVTILGGGGITRALAGLLAPFRARVTVVRRQARPVHGAERVVTTAALRDVLPGALVVFVALALTPQTAGIIGAPELTRMDPGAWLVNIARGGHVDTGALTAALESGRIGGAALDVTDPEPLPPGHPLWSLPNCVITPHTANTQDMLMPRLADRIAANVARFAAGKPLDGRIDPAAGY